MLELWDIERDLLTTRVLAAASLGNSEDASSSMKELVNRALPFLDAKSTKDQWRKVMEREMKRGPLRVTPITSPKEARTLHSSKMKESLARDRERIRKGLD